MSTQGQQLISHVRLGRATAAIQRSINDALDQHQHRALDTITAAMDPDPFGRDSWATTVMNTVRPIIQDWIGRFVDWVVQALGLGDSESQVRANIDYQVQVDDFVSRVETLGHITADGVYAEIQQGMARGEDAAQIQRRIEDRFGIARSDAARIARTETHRAAEQAKYGAAETSQQMSGSRMAKKWLTQLDVRVRKTHVRAYGQEVALDVDFHVGLGQGPMPGMIGLPEEDIECRCVVAYRTLDDGEAMPVYVPQGSDRPDQDAA